MKERFHARVMSIHWFDTPFGRCGIAWSGRELTGFRLPETADAVRQAALTEADAHLPAWVTAITTRVRTHLAGRLEDFSDLPYAWSCVSDFKRDVYLKTLRISPGATSTYGAIARALGLDNDGARAVGMALGANPWPLVIPCHRVVSSSGAMTGFSGPGGIRTKTRLLVLEGAELISE